MRFLGITVTAVIVAFLIWLTHTYSYAAPAPKLLDVDVALVLVVDTSESVDEGEYALQKLGLAAAFSDPVMIQAITGGALGRIAVMVVHFSNFADVSVPWVVIDSAQSAKLFATQIALVPRSEDLGSTSISAGITMAAQAIATSPFRATRRVIDVSGDGANNFDDYYTPVNMETARELAEALKITINGLPIQDAEDDLEAFYREWVLLGKGSFLISAKDSTDFARAIKRKLIQEIS